MDPLLAMHGLGVLKGIGVRRKAMRCQTARTGNGMRRQYCARQYECNMTNGLQPTTCDAPLFVVSAW
jgi:hypothetical protein